MWDDTVICKIFDAYMLMMKKTFSETITSQRPKGVTLVKQLLRLMEELLHHLAYKKPCKSWDIYHINWCRISSINGITVTVYVRMFWWQKGSRSRWEFSEDSIIQMIQDSKNLGVRASCNQVSGGCVLDSAPWDLPGDTVVSLESWRAL